MDVEGNPVFRCIEGKAEGVFSMHPIEIAVTGAVFVVTGRLHPILGLMLAGASLLGLKTLRKRDHGRSDYLVAWARCVFAPSRRYRPADIDHGYRPLRWE